MKKTVQLIFFFVLLLALAVGASLVTRVLLPAHCTMCGGPGLLGARGADDFAWLQEELKLSPEQQAALAPAHQRYTKEVEARLEEIRLSNQALGEVILEEKRDSRRVQAAMAQVHEAQARLQRLTLEHIFSIEAHVTPEQYALLLEHACTALREMDCQPMP